MRLAASSLTPLLVFLVIAFTQSAHGLVDDRSSASEATAKAAPITVQEEIKVIPTEPIQTKNETIAPVVVVSTEATTKELPGAEDAVIAALAESENVANVTKVMREYNMIGNPADSIFAKKLTTELQAHNVNMSEPKVQDLVQTLIKQWSTFEKAGGERQCEALRETLNRVADGIQPKVELQEAANKMHLACKDAFINGEMSMIKSGNAVMTVVHSLLPANVTADAITSELRDLTTEEVKAAQDTIVALLTDYNTAAIAEKAEAEKEEQEEAVQEVRLQKRGLREYDLAIDAKTKRPVMRQSLAFVGKVAKYSAYIIGAKIAIAVKAGNVKEMAGLRYALALRDTMWAKTDRPPVFNFKYEQMRNMTKKQFNKLVATPGMYTFTGVPAKGALGGGLDMTGFPSEARELVAGMCSSPLEWQRWNVGVTLHPRSAVTNLLTSSADGSGMWCRGTVILNVRAEGVFAPFESLELKRRDASQTLALVKEVLGMSSTASFKRYAYILMLSLYFVLAGTSLTAVATTASPGLVCLYFKDSLWGGARYVFDKMLGYASQRAKSEAISRLPAPLQALNRYNVFSKVFSWRRKAAAPAAIADDAEDTFPVENDDEYDVEEAPSRQYQESVSPLERLQAIRDADSFGSWSKDTASAARAAAAIDEDEDDEEDALEEYADDDEEVEEQEVDHEAEYRSNLLAELHAARQARAENARPAATYRAPVATPYRPYNNVRTLADYARPTVGNAFSGEGRTLTGDRVTPSRLADEFDFDDEMPQQYSGKTPEYVYASSPYGMRY